MEGLKDLLAPKTLHWFSYVANVFWILLGIILSPIFLDIENSEPTDFRCGSNDDKELIRGKCYEDYDKQYNKFPVYGFVIINFLVTASVCGIYSQAVKSKVEELENNPRNPNLGQTSRKKLFKAYCLQLLARFVLGIFFLVLQTKLLYPHNFPSNFNCNLTRDGKFSVTTTSASRNETKTQMSYECHNQRGAKKTVWANAVIVVTGTFALLVFIESLYMLLCRARKVSFRAFTEDQEFHKCYLSSSKPTDEQVPRKTERSDRDPLCHSDEGERLEEYPKTRENSQQTIPGDIFGAEKQKTLDVGRPGIGKTMATRNDGDDDGDVQDKGRRLWDALKNKKIDRGVDRISIIGTLLKKGAPVNFREPNSKINQRTPLHFVVYEIGGDDDLLDVLLENGADANLVDGFGYTPLHLAAEKGNLGAVKALVRNPYSPADYSKQSNLNETPLQVAERRGHHHVKTYLLKLERGETDVQSDGTGVDESVDGSVVRVNFHADDCKVNLMVGNHSTMNLNSWLRHLEGEIRENAVSWTSFNNIVKQ